MKVSIVTIILLLNFNISAQKQLDVDTLHTTAFYLFDADTIVIPNEEDLIFDWGDDTAIEAKTYKNNVFTRIYLDVKYLFRRRK